MVPAKRDYPVTAVVDNGRHQIGRSMLASYPVRNGGWYCFTPSKPQENAFEKGFSRICQRSRAIILVNLKPL
jgi:hypothetical protein